MSSALEEILLRLYMKVVLNILPGLGRGGGVGRGAL